MAKHKLTKKKARQILHDKKIRGRKLTTKQVRFFGLIAGGGTPSRLGRKKKKRRKSKKNKGRIKTKKKK